MGKSLHGERILITREETKAAEMAEKVTNVGGIPVIVPMIEINFIKTLENNTILEQLSDFGWVFITSANGVHGFFQLLRKQHIELPKALKIGIVGKKTEEVLHSYGHTASFVPATFDASTMAEEFLSFYKLDKPVLLIRGNLSRPTLPEKLREEQIPYEILEVYETTYCKESKQKLDQVLSSVEYITFTSPSTVEAFVLLAEYIPDTATYICIGKTTEEKAKELGIPNLYTSSPYTTDAMVTLIEKISNERKINHE
ncbi:uroporphyrinogen-III synthase [Oceanobacillus sp. J11TS1]|uniref:uroporphyrinogen-III synthase n=1 Tax=Oceanobacillus sp. J11TS1 TaxID=2807191 RepID=UPI001B272D86|nr:uroporphyrinogen-III synthase [Oceanobacillus sp. J11TS1]GIO21774.1 uroporphyrinogen-III synthase [Oceanobacillus sp. J11TS1]